MTKITIDRATVEQALEALENFAMFQRMMMDGPDTSDKLLAEDYAEVAFLQGARAMPVLRQALEQPAQQQEPVAWLFTNVQSGDWDFCYQEDEHDDDMEMWHKQPLYAHPAERKLEDKPLEPVIDKSAAIRIATALGWEPKKGEL